MASIDLYNALQAVSAPRNGGAVGYATGLAQADQAGTARRASMAQALAALGAPAASSMNSGNGISSSGGYSPTGLPRGRGLTTITAPNGQKVTVSATYAGKFSGLLNDLWNAGYRFSSVGGYNYRNIAGTNTLSKHAFGEAIDIDPGKNPVTYNGRAVTEFNPNIVLPILRKYGLDWGYLWSGKKDPMHFSTGG